MRASASRDTFLSTWVCTAHSTHASATIDHLDGYMEALARPGAPPPQLFGINLVDHVDLARLPDLVAATRKAGTWNVPTQILLENWYGPADAETMRQWPEMQYASRDEVQRWVAQKRKFDEAYSAEHRARSIQRRRQILKALHDGGAGLLLGSDAPQTWNVPGFPRTASSPRTWPPA